MNDPGANPSSAAAARIFRPIVVIPALLLVALGGAWLLPPNVTLGAAHTDLIGQFVAWRAFAADSIRAGDFPLWNPYTYSGQPFLGGFQSALLYPPNAVFLVLPLSRAITFTILAHLLLLGAGVAWWSNRRGLHPAAGVTTAIAFALSGVVLPHVYAGHLSNLCTMAWVPWAFAGLETWWRERRASGLLLASAAIALQILAGQVQYVFFFGVAAGVHAVAAMIFEPAARRRALLGLAAGCLGAVALAAAQILPGFEAAKEGVRQGALDYRFASAFALPPENVFTALVPGFFGELKPGGAAYWGRCYLWEMSIYLGIGGIFFAAAAVGRRDSRQFPRIDLLAAALLLLLALGRHLPIYSLLYAHVPGFSQFRGMSKFTFPALLLATMAAAAGIDAVLRRDGHLRTLAVSALALGVLLAVFGAWFHFQPEAVRGIFEWIRARANDDLIAPATFPDGGAAQAVGALSLGAALCAALGACLWLAKSHVAARWLAVALLPLDLLLFARTTLATTPVDAAMPRELRDFVAHHPGEYRVLNLARPNGGHLLGAPDLWGNDPGVLRRYAEFMTFTQGGDPNAATQNLAFGALDRLYAMLRCRYAFVPTATGVNIVDFPNPLPRLLFVSEFQVMPDRDAIFRTLREPQFDPQKRVVLEQSPSPAPAAGAPAGHIRVVRSDNDTLALEAEVDRATLLLITDLFSTGWRVRALPGSTQSRYELMPANYILQAVPLAAGRHALELAYQPRTLKTGAIISILAWLTLLVTGVRMSGRSRPRTAA